MFRCDDALNSALRLSCHSFLSGETAHWAGPGCLDLGLLTGAGRSRSKNTWKGEKNMNAQNLPANAQNTRPRVVRSDVAEEAGKNVPTLDEINRRALEIHVERGDHSCDLDDYLDDWLQAERELRERYNKNSVQ
jgi:hypothetical protein